MYPTLRAGQTLRGMATDTSNAASQSVRDSGLSAGTDVDCLQQQCLIPVASNSVQNIDVENVFDAFSTSHMYARQAEGLHTN